MKVVDYAFANKFRGFIVGSEVVLADSADLRILSELFRIAGHVSAVRQVPDEEFQSSLDGFYSQIGGDSESLVSGISANAGSLEDALLEAKAAVDLLNNDDDAPTIKLLNAIFLEALKRKASDIHVELFDGGARIRVRVDGVLVTIAEPPVVLASKLISRVKVLGKLDIAEKRLPQDGRLSLRLANREIDLRVSTLPAMHGERVVMRLLEKQSQNLDLEKLGLSAAQQSLLSTLLRRPNGVILVTGPTGSGKTTTLYSALQSIASSDRNIMTVEDPVEYDLPGISQTQISVKTGFDFAKGLKAILRQDPDVILVGEIRDAETAEIAVQASLTGHLVLSTLHTNSAAGAITRLADLGVESFLLSSSLRGVLAQRLVRILCNSCRTATTITSEETQLLSDLGAKIPSFLYRPKGCDRCAHTGFLGRQGLYELVEVDADLRQMIHDEMGEIAIENAIRRTVPSLLQSGAKLVAAGRTTLDEVLKVVVD